MILKIHQSKYYGYQNKNKEMFKKKYRSVGLKWMTEVNLNSEVVDGWFSSDMKEYLLKLPEEGELKRFTGNSTKMIEFLLSCGAEVIDKEERGTHIDYDDKKGFITQKDRYGSFIGADLINHYRVEELLKDVLNNWGCVWSNKVITVLTNSIEVEEIVIEKTDTEKKERSIQVLSLIKDNVKNIPMKKKVIIRRKINNDKM